ncbi:MAG TPA: RidA family protein [Conexibacter sp.]|nr:RidA family protein [Conexibacter sp.]
MFSDPVEIRGPGAWIFVSGQVGLDAEGRLPEDFATQTHLCFEHVRRSLARAGATFADVVQIRTYLTAFEADYETFSAIRSETFGASLPASAAVEVTKLALGASIEIEAIAFLPADGAAA